MIRRHFLLSTVASLLALVLPRQAGAVAPLPDYSHIPVAKLELIEEAFDVGEVYKFDLAKRLSHFGFYAHGAATPAQMRHKLHTWVLEFGNVDIWNRVRFIAAIRAELEKRHPGDIAAQVRLMDQPGWFDGLSIRDLMNTRRQADLYWAAYALGSSIDYHGFAEMDAYT